MNKRDNNRKRITAVLLLTVLAVGGMLFYGERQKAAVPTVETVTLERKTVKETVICAGNVAAAEGVKVYAPMPCVVGDIAVKKGDRVKQGDVLLTVDRSATLAMAVSAGLPSEQSVMASAALPEAVTAPQAGVVSAVSVKTGALLDTQAPCVVLSEGDGLVVSVVIKEKILPRMAVGQTVSVSGVAFDKEEYTGVIATIADTARSRVSGGVSETVVDATVRLDEGQADDSLLVGLTAKAAVTVDSREDVLLIPYECLAQDDQGKAFVYRVNGDVAQRVAVILGEELSQGVIVQGGVTDGDVLVCAPEQLSGEAAAIRTEVA